MRYSILLLTAFPVVLPSLMQVKAEANSSAPSAITTQAPVQELLAGYLKWMHRHPQVMPKATKKGEDPSPFFAPVPAIDLYSPSGSSVYFEAKPKNNAEFLRSMRPALPPVTKAQPSTLRPTLSEAMEMFPELKSYQTLTSGDVRYTVFALTNSGDEYCREQDEAVAQLKSRAQALGIRVIEVKLHK